MKIGNKYRFSKGTQQIPLAILNKKKKITNGINKITGFSSVFYVDQLIVGL